MKTLRPVPEYCTGCHLCVLGCSFAHNDVFSEALARMHVSADEARWDFAPVVCRQCADAPCAAACPTAAISRDAVTKAVLLDPDACTGCQACVVACPFDAVIYNGSTEKVQLCDLCSGDPECVISCPHSAIEYAEADGARGGNLPWFAGGIRTGG